MAERPPYVPVVEGLGWWQVWVGCGDDGGRKFYADRWAHCFVFFVCHLGGMSPYIHVLIT